LSEEVEDINEYWMIHWPPDISVPCGTGKPESSRRAIVTGMKGVNSSIL